MIFATSTVTFAQSLIPVGKAVGVCIISDGLLIVKTSAVSDIDGKEIFAAEKAGIKKGDRIISADGNTLKSAEQLAHYVEERSNDIVLCVQRNGENINKVITPVKTQDGYKLGIWIKDSMAGIGTITFLNPDNGSYAALGHGISDSETGMLMPAAGGGILPCNVTEPIKGKPGDPGELNGGFENEYIGTVEQNTLSGIYGRINTPKISGECMEVGEASEIQCSEAQIIAEVDNTGIKSYKIKIQKINNDNNDGKNIVFTVCDEELIKKTGGIVQGMSGSPIIQNNKLVGAVTHVFVNDPTRGYGIFIENMLAEAEKIK